MNEETTTELWDCNLEVENIPTTPLGAVAAMAGKASYRDLLPQALPNGLLLSLVRDTSQFDSGQHFSAISDPSFAALEHILKAILSKRAIETGQEVEIARVNCRSLAISLNHFLQQELINRIIGRIDDCSEELLETIDYSIRLEGKPFQFSLAKLPYRKTK